MHDAPIVQKVYDLYRALYPVIEKMPKRDKYTLGERISVSTLVVLECLIAASYAARDKKLALLQQTTIKLDVLKMLLRLAEEVKAIPTKAYLTLTEQLTEIGRMLGGWIRSIK